MLTNNGFEMMIASGPDHEQVFVEIYCDGKLFAMISREHLSSGCFIEVPGMNFQQDRLTRKVDWNAFREIAERACARLNGDAP